MKKATATIIFILCAVSMSSLYAMQLVTRKKGIVLPALQQSRYCSGQGYDQLEKEIKLRKKTNKLFSGNILMCAATIGAACAVNNPYLLLPVVPYVTRAVGVEAIGFSMHGHESDLLRYLAVFTEIRKEAIADSLHKINHTNQQIAQLKHYIAEERKLEYMGLKTLLLTEYSAVLSDRQKLKYEFENALINQTAPLFNTHENLQACLLYNEKRIRALDKAWLFKLSSAPLALLPKMFRKFSSADQMSDFNQCILAANTAMVSILACFFACIAPLDTACVIATMEMAYRNQSFFEHKDLDTKKENLKQISALIRLHQDRRSTNS